MLLEKAIVLALIAIGLFLLLICLINLVLKELAKQQSLLESLSYRLQDIAAELDRINLEHRGMNKTLATLEFVDELLVPKKQRKEND
ncbi:MAG: hypothetical protein KGV43_02885 [Arcobacter sp.]|nr:hypothetical protein [Arcobacter sp.]